MKVIFDHLCFWQRYGGVARYFVELYRHLPAGSAEMTVRYSNNHYLKEAGIRVRPFIKGWSFRGKPRLEKQWGKIFSLSRLRQANYDVYHQTHYDCYAYRFLPPTVARVTTLHDANFFTIPTLYKPHSTLRRAMIRSAEMADHIITVSYNSKQEICRFLGCPEQKISVIYHGVNHTLYQQAPQWQRTERYILYVGARNAYKNFIRLCDAFALIRHKENSLWLYCCGERQSRAEYDMLRAKAIADRVKFLSPTDQELASLYKSAQCFVFPSLAEGFGLPIVEAMAAGCPTVLSNRSCFPEIAQQAALYFDAEDIEQMAEQILRCCSDEALQQRLKREGELRSANFTWQHSAQEHIELYNRLRR